MTLHLSQRYLPATPDDGDGFEFCLMNAGQGTVITSKFCYCSMTRIRDDAQVTGGRLDHRFASHVAIRPTVTELAPGATLTLVIRGLTHAPRNRSQGALAAWVEDDRGAAVEATIGDLTAPPGRATGPLKQWPAGHSPTPLGLLPWPGKVAVTDWDAPRIAFPAAPSDAPIFAEVAALHRRLFPLAKAPLSAQPEPGGLPVTTAHEPHPAGGYRLGFADGAVTLGHHDAQGRVNGLIALAQILHHAFNHHGFARPAAGEIVDAPRFEWRGAHLDVARNFRDARTVLRFVDILAWHRFSHFHWHLTDDEGWRLPSHRFPALTERGARRARGTPLLPQFADGPDGQSGHYSPDEVARIVARAGTFGITVMPEIDIPGHVTALLTALPELRDPDEPAASYRSIQGYPNNALNPALPRTWAILEDLLDEVCAMFPARIVHVGGDEVDGRAWHASPAARALGTREGLSGAPELQAHFMRRVQGMLARRGRVLGGWDECAGGGGIARAGAVMFAWQSAETAARLVAEGYDVVATPGHAYYLDMMQAAGWNEPGAAWAGASTPAACYDFEPTAQLPAGPGRLIGVQAGIWTETIIGREGFNHMVFPRLSAIAETGWTQPRHKDRDRFMALSHLMPRL